jgi:hypothetical protein
VQAAGDQFLAGAGFAVDQHVGGAVGQGADQAADAGHAGRVADQPGFELVALVELAAQGAHFEHQAAFSSARRAMSTSCSGAKGFCMKS